MIQVFLLKFGNSEFFQRPGFFYILSLGPAGVFSGWKQAWMSPGFMSENLYSCASSQLPLQS